MSVPINGLPIFVRAGAIVPVGPDTQYADEYACCEPLTIYVYRGGDGRFALYNDAGDGYGYERGEYLRTTYVWHDAEGQLEQTVEGDARFEMAEPQIEVIG